MKALILKELGRKELSEKHMREGFELFDPVEMMDDWELYWCMTAARQLGDHEKIKAIEAEQKKRKMPTVQQVEGMLPEIKQRK